VKDYAAGWRIKRRISNILLITAALAGLAALSHAGKTGWYLGFGQKASGVVIEVEHNGSFHPVVEYRTQDGEVRRHRGNAVADGDYREGDWVVIRYFDSDPAAAVISSGFADTWLVPSLYAVTGLIVGIVALVLRPNRR
jgi:hypothetical protein